MWRVARSENWSDFIIKCPIRMLLCHSAMHANDFRPQLGQVPLALKEPSILELETGAKQLLREWDTCLRACNSKATIVLYTVCSSTLDLPAGKDVERSNGFP